MAQLVIEIDQDHADYDQLGSIAADFAANVAEHSERSGVRVRAMTMTDEFGGMVARWEDDKAIFVLPGGEVKVQHKPE